VCSQLGRVENKMNENEILKLLNPMIEVERYPNPSLPSQIFNLINDKICIGGTKQRFLYQYISMISQDEIIYAGPEGGLGHVALALVSFIYQKQAVIFCNGTWKPNSTSHPLIDLSIGFNAIIKREYDLEDYTSLKQAQERAQEYVDENESNRFLLPFGLRSDPSELPFQCFRSAIISSLPNIFQYYIPVRLWLAAGSGFLLTVLHSLWPSTTFMIVQVGKKIPKDLLDSITSYELFIAPESFGENAVYPPSYETIPWYDAKIWRFILLYGMDGDFIWNVGALPEQDPSLVSQQIKHKFQQLCPLHKDHPAVSLE
jgi:hypothetical protein